MQYHEYANLFPMLASDKLQDLAADIKANGQKEPILSFEGKILDGRNRFEACAIAGVDPVIVAWFGEDPVGEVISRNIHRRHLTPSQASMIAQEAATMRKGGQEGNRNNNKSNTAGAAFDSDKKTQHQAAKDFGISPDSVQRARKVAENGVPELGEAVKEGKVAVKTAALVAQLPKEHQSEIVAQGTDAIKNAAREVREYGAEAVADKGVSKEPRNIYVAKNGLQIASMVTAQLDRITDPDKEFEPALRAVIAYCEKRLAQNTKK